MLSALAKEERERECCISLSASRAHAGDSSAPATTPSPPAACLIHLASCLPVVVSSFTLLQFVAVPRTWDCCCCCCCCCFFFDIFTLLSTMLSSVFRVFSFSFSPLFAAAALSLSIRAILPICSNAKWQFNFSVLSSFSLLSLVFIQSRRLCLCRLQLASVYLHCFLFFFPCFWLRSFTVVKWFARVLPKLLQSSKLFLLLFVFFMKATLALFGILLSNVVASEFFFLLFFYFLFFSFFRLPNDTAGTAHYCWTLLNSKLELEKCEQTVNEISGGCIADVSWKCCNSSSRMS